MTLNKNTIRPREADSARADSANFRRRKAAQIAQARASHLPHSNHEELLYPATQPTNFTKGLHHNAFGFASRQDYEGFVRSLTEPELDLASANPAPNARKWESPLGGFSYDLEGPDTGAMAMAPAPLLGRSELCAEIATLYAMALTRDIPFRDLAKPSTSLTYAKGRNPDQSAAVAFTFPQGHPRAGQKATIEDLVNELRKLSWHDPNRPTTGTNGQTLTDHEKRRRASLWENGDPQLGLTIRSLFRGSTPGAKRGPYLSQFLLVGSQTHRPSKAGTHPENGKIEFGTQPIDQMHDTAMPHHDYLQSWEDWRDVQNGANRQGQDIWRRESRFLTTPRDIATYVHFDQLYQAYFNALLIMLQKFGAMDGVQVDPGNPITMSRSAKAKGFATWGGPHFLALFAEVSSRGLRAVRRQKFQIHRRCRPEVLAARLTQVANGQVGEMDKNAIQAIQTMLAELGAGTPEDASKPGVLLHWISILNEDALSTQGKTSSIAGKPIDPGRNFLLPLAFPEGSPMHPAYGAGHATVAGACVTVLKAVLKTDDVPAMTALRTDMYHEPSQNGDKLEPTQMLGEQTISDELDKLAANIAIARNIAGVHYYSDYYDSLRLGERVAVGILTEQMLTYPEAVRLTFRSYDGDTIEIVRAKPADTVSTGKVEVLVNGSAGNFDAWWLRDVVDYPTTQPSVAAIAPKGKAA